PAQRSPAAPVGRALARHVPLRRHALRDRADAGCAGAATARAPRSGRPLRPLLHGAALRGGRGCMARRRPARVGRRRRARSAGIRAVARAARRGVRAGCTRRQRGRFARRPRVRNGENHPSSMTPALLLQALWLAQAAQPEPRPLAPGAEMREALAGGERVVYSIDVPAGHAAKVLLRQEGADLVVTLRRAGSEVPRFGLDMASGPAGEELVFPPVLDEPAAWHVLVRPILPKAPRGEFTVSFELEPADERSRSVAEARRLYQAAAVTSTSTGNTAESQRKARDQYAEAALAAAGAGDAVLAAEATYQSARSSDRIGEVPAAFEGQRRALQMFRALGRRDREA